MIHPTPAASCLSSLALDQLLADELDDVATASARSHLDQCAACRERWSQINAFRRSFRAAPPPLDLVAARPSHLRVIDGGLNAGRDQGQARASATPDDQRAEPVWRPMPVRRGRAWQWLAAAGSLAAAAALVLVLGSDPGPGNQPGTEPGDVTRSKGDSRVTFFISHRGQVRRGHSGDIVYPDDALQFVYWARQPGYLAILSRDGAGTASVYFADGDRAALMEAGAEEPLPHSIVLDHVLGRERVHILTCAEPVALGPLRLALGQSPGPLVAPASCTVTEIVLDKSLP